MKQDPPAVQRARDRIRELVEERRRLEEFLETYETLSKPGPRQGQSPAAETPRISFSISSRSTSAPTPNKEVLDTVRVVLREHGRPMLLKDLYDAIRRRGVVIGGKVPTNNLGAKLSTAKDLVTTKGVGWWFVEERHLVESRI